MENPMDNNHKKLERLQRELDEAETELNTATERYVSSRDVSVRASIQARDAQYCAAQGLLVSQDQTYIDQLGQQADEAKATLVRSRRQLVNSNQKVSDLRTSLERVEKDVLADEQRAWVKKHRPDVLSELETAKNACHDLYQSRAEGTTGHAQRVLQAQSRFTSAQDAYNAAFAERQ
jgi:hypothetical protein